MKRTLIIGVVVIATINLYWPIRSIYKDYQKHVFLEQAETKYQQRVKASKDARREIVKFHNDLYDDLKAAGNHRSAIEELNAGAQAWEDSDNEIEAETKAIEKLRREML